MKALKRSPEPLYRKLTMPNGVGPPIAVPEGILFTFKDIISTPETPKMDESFTVKGGVELLKLPFVAPIWVIVTAEYPETWWEEIIPIIGAPQVREMAMVLGGNFEVTFPGGFQREGEFKLTTRLYAGPTLPINKVTLPPFPPVATYETTFMVVGEIPEEEKEGFRNLKILSYSKNGGAPVTPPNVLELEVGDRCRVNFSFEHKGSADTGKLYAAIGNYGWAGFDEIIANSKSFSVTPSSDWEPFENSVDIPITTAISPGSGYDLYGKIMGIPGADIFTRYVEDVITITGVPTAGEFRNFSIASYSPAVLGYGDMLTIVCSFEYRGPRYTKADIHAAIGKRGAVFFDEILAKSIALEPFGPDEDWRAYEVEISIPITTAISPGTGYDLYSKLTDIPGADLYDYKDDIIEIIGAPVPELGNVRVLWNDREVAIGDTCRVHVAFDYQGPATSKRLYAAIGNYGWAGFDEILVGSTTITIPETFTWQTYERDVNIRITTAIDPARSPYDLYAKINGVLSPFYRDAATIKEEVPPPPPPEEEYTLTVSVQPTKGGYTSPSGTRTYLEGKQVTIRAYPYSGYEFDHWGGDASGTSPTITVTMDRDKLVVAVFREIAPPTGISFSVELYNIPYWLQPVYEWYIIWRGKTYGRWTSASYAITLDNVSATGAMSVVLKHNGTTHKFTTRTYALEDGVTYRFNVETVTLEGA